MTIFSTAHTLLEDGTGHKKMRMEPTARVKRMTPLKQVSSGLAALNYRTVATAQQLSLRCRAYLRHASAL
jgi:sensor domain CHASE-containing protein